ncbi:MAG: multiubiquitin domain-containing protein [Candidatus Methylomirabilales bacterium]
MRETQTQRGQKFFVNIEGTVHPWDKDTITTEEIIALGGWDPSLGVIEIDKDNNERTLRPGEVIDLKPGHGFAKKVRWKRG